MKGSKWLPAVLFLLIAAFAVALTGNAVSSAIGSLSSEDARIPSIVLPVILILSVSIVLIVLASITAVFSSLKLANSTHALGLPEGSVRAVIALSLIFIFITTAIYLYSEIDGKTAHYNNITQTILDDIPSSEIVQISAKEVNGEIVYDVARRIEVTGAEKELAIQILTTVSTLVVAIAAFYFGAKSVTVTDRILAPTLPILFNDINPEKGMAGKKVEITISGRNLGSIHNAKLELNGDNSVKDIVTNVQPGSDIQIKCTFDLVNASIGKWDLIVEDTSGNQARLPEAFEVTKAEVTEGKE